MNKSYTILAIDTSLDETSAAVTIGRRVLSNVVSSQVELHKKYGGVVPIITKRAHEERIMPVVTEALRRATSTLKRLKLPKAQEGLTLSDIHAFAVTVGPGQALALGVGIETVKRLAREYEKPVVAVNHMEGHLLSPFVQNAKGGGSNVSKVVFQSRHGRAATNAFPLLGLLISGGHTQLVLMRDFGQYELLGETLDDAVGEAFDKVGRMLGLGYPGGPIIEQVAKDGDEYAYDFPVPMRRRHRKDYDFSYSGIKTALLYLTNDLKKQGKLDKKTTQDLAASFQRVVALSLTDKLKLAVTETKPNGLLLGGGVVSNLYIRNAIRAYMKSVNLPVYIPYSKKLFTDNAAMIGVCAYYQAKRNDFVSDSSTLDRKPNLSL